jgi:hypothetical protein
MTVAVGVLGVALVLLAFADLINTLITTSTSLARGWPSQLLTRVSHRLIRFVAVRLGEGSTARERLLATFAPLLLLELLTIWVLLQLVGFGLIWSPSRWWSATSRRFTPPRSVSRCYRPPTPRCSATSPTATDHAAHRNTRRVSRVHHAT